MTPCSKCSKCTYTISQRSLTGPPSTSCLAFEELIRLSHLNVHSVWDSLWKSRFYIFLTVPLMSADNVQQLPGSPHLIIKSLAAETNSADPSYALLCVFLAEKQLPFMPPTIFTLLLLLNIICFFLCQPLSTYCFCSAEMVYVIDGI